MNRPPAVVSDHPPARRLAELHHQLRSALAAATLSLETTQMLAHPATHDPAVARSIDRALSSIQEALRLADEIRAEERGGSQAGPECA